MMISHAEQTRRRVAKGDTTRRRTAFYGAKWFDAFCGEPPANIIAAFRKAMPREDFAALAIAFAHTAADTLPQSCGD